MFELQMKNAFKNCNDHKKKIVMRFNNRNAVKITMHSFIEKFLFIKAKMYSHLMKWDFPPDQCTPF